MLRLVVVLLIFFICHLASGMSPYSITTIAGSDSKGDGLPAISATYQKPNFIKYSSKGEIYVADKENFNIRKISSNGKVSTIVGMGVSGDSGEGGLAVSAKIGTPFSLDVNSYGEVIFSDSNNKIKRIYSNGTISTIFSSSTVVGVAFHPLTGEIYFGTQNTIRKIDSNGNIVTVGGTGLTNYNDDGPALSTNISSPSHMVFNGNGDLYFIEATVRIRKLSNGQITTFTTVPQPSCLAIKPETNDVVIPCYDSRIRLVSAINGSISIIAGTGSNGFGGDGGLATNAKINGDELGATYSPNGDLYLADGSNSVIRKVSAVDGIISTISGGLFGDGYQANQYGVLQSPSGVALSSTGELLIADKNAGLIRKVSLNGVISTIAGSYRASYSEGVLATLSGLIYPTSIVTRPNGDIYFTDQSLNRIFKISAVDGKISTIAGNDDYTFTPDGALANETFVGTVLGIVFNSKGDLIFSEKSNHRIRKIQSNGTVVTIAGIDKYGISGGDFSGDGGLAINTQVNCPYGMVITPSDDIIFVDLNNNRIRIIYSNGTINTIAGNGNYAYSNIDGELAIESPLALTGGIVMNSMGEVIFSEDPVIRKLSNGILQTIAGRRTNGYSGDGQLAINAELNNPVGLTIDSNDNIYIADASNNRIRKISRTCPSPSIWTGTECFSACFGVNSNDVMVCSGRGQCNNTDTCTCVSPYYGNNCELYDCNGIAKNSSQVCSVSGTCQSPNNCTCQPGYSGANCELFTCNGIDKNSPQVCSSHGTCKSPEVCSCQLGYYGSNCESFNCSGIHKNSPQVCSAKGVCQSPNNCTCLSGYYGANCESFVCNGIDRSSSEVCSSHGTCETPNTCSCQLGYYGANCESFNCSGVLMSSPQVCSAHGTCQGPNNCTCQSGYYGINCESFNCTGIKSTSPNVCSSRGQCTAPNTCKCSGNSFGSNCEFIVTSSLKISATNSQLAAISQLKLNNSFKSQISTFVLLASLLIVLIQ